MNKVNSRMKYSINKCIEKIEEIEEKKILVS